MTSRGLWPELDARFDRAMHQFNRAAERVSELKELVDNEKRRGVLRNDDLLATLLSQLDVAIERMTDAYLNAKAVHDENVRIKAFGWDPSEGGHAAHV